MDSSIALPLPQHAGRVAAPTRSFIVFQTGEREVAPWPLTPEAIADLNEARRIVVDSGPVEMTWCCTLFFPEAWPPTAIAQELWPAWPGFFPDEVPTFNSGISLPIASRLDTNPTFGRYFMECFHGWREVSGESFTAESLARLMADTREMDELHGRVTDWCQIMFFPEAWPPGRVDDYLRSSHWQGSLLPY